MIISGQNMTEGVPTHANLMADAFIGQEVKAKLVRPAFREKGKRVYVPKRDPHQCLAWDPDTFHITKTGWEMFHRSGEAEDWKIATPARGLIWAKGTLAYDDDIKIALAGWWAINSWGKDNAEGPFRKRIMLDYTLPVVHEWIERMHDQDRTIFMEADSNNVRWNAKLPGMTLLNKQGGLDHMWVSTHGAFDLSKRGVWHGPETGVGPDMKHESLNASFVRA